VTLNKTRADVLRVRISDQFLPLAADALCWRAAFSDRWFRRTAFEAVRIDFIFECAFYRAQVDSGRLWDLGSMYTNDKDSRWIVTLPIVTRPHE
jgi:hypothetical protein